jgi:hypothetical protein
LFGHALGGPEAERWVGILQALLAGWVMYVGAAGMLFEGLLRLRQKFTADLAIAATAVLMYLASLLSLLGIVVNGRLLYRPLMFHLSVLVIAVWAGMMWYRMSRHFKACG